MKGEKNRGLEKKKIWWTLKCTKKFDGNKQITR